MVSRNDSANELEFVRNAMSVIPENTNVYIDAMEIPDTSMAQLFNYKKIKYHYVTKNVIHIT